MSIFSALWSTKFGKHWVFKIFNMLKSKFATLLILKFATCVSGHEIIPGLLPTEWKHRTACFRTRVKCLACRVPARTAAPGLVSVGCSRVAGARWDWAETSWALSRVQGKRQRSEWPLRTGRVEDHPWYSVSVQWSSTLNQGPAHRRSQPLKLRSPMQRPQLVVLLRWSNRQSMQLVSTCNGTSTF